MQIEVGYEQKKFLVKEIIDFMVERSLTVAYQGVLKELFLNGFIPLDFAP